MPFYKILDDAIAVDDTTFTGATSATMQVIFNQAVSSGLPLQVRPGNYDFGNTSISGPIVVQGVPGTVNFRMTAGSEYILYMGAFTSAHFFGINFDGQNAAFTANGTLIIQGLVNMQKASGTLISRASYERCTFKNSTLSGLSVNEVRTSVRDCVFSACQKKSIGVVSVDELTVIGSRFEDQDYAIHCSPGAALNVNIDGNVIKRCRRNGIAFEPSGSVKVNQNLSIRGNKITKLLAADLWAVSRTDLATKGAEGNGILVYLSNNVVISDNDASDCQFSGIRANVSSQMTVTGNIFRGSGETALYVEASSAVGEYGATVTGNVVYGGGAGISVVNFDPFNGRFATVSGNIVRDIATRDITSTAGNYKTAGTGIYVEGDASVSGNTIQNCYFGLALGTGIFTSDLIATGNVIRQTTLGIGVSGTSTKEILISGNLIAGYSSGAIKTFTYSETVPLIISGADLAPANLASLVSGKINMIGNVKRAVL
jgi:putative cofactor-binding repeat protein/parallel beta-helix repeat protein